MPSHPDSHCYNMLPHCYKTCFPVANTSNHAHMRQQHAHHDIMKQFVLSCSAMAGWQPHGGLLLSSADICNAGFNFLHILTFPTILTQLILSASTVFHSCARIYILTLTRACDFDWTRGLSNYASGQHARVDSL